MNGWNAKEFFRWVRGKKIAFIGVGVTNTDCIRLFAKKGGNSWALWPMNLSKAASGWCWETAIWTA